MRRAPSHVFLICACLSFLATGLAPAARASVQEPKKSGAEAAAKAASAPPVKTTGPQSGAKKEAFEKAMASAKHMQKANAFIKAGNYAAAESELIAADALTPDYCAVLVQLSTVQRRTGKSDTALATLERAIRRGKGFDDKAYLLAARIFSEKKAFAAGEKKLIEWAGDRQVSADFHAAIGILRLEAYDLGPAEIELRAALKADPANEAALTGMSQLYGHMNQYPRLQPILDKALAAKPGSVPVLILAGNSLLRQDRWAEAKERFETILKIDPGNAAARVNLGSALHGLGDTQGAIGSFLKAIEADPKNIEAPINLALALEREKKPAEARDTLLAAKARGIDNLDVLNALAMAYHLNGEIGPAKAAIRESLGRDPNQPAMKKLLEQLEDGTATSR